MQRAAQSSKNFPLWMLDACHRLRNVAASLPMLRHLFHLLRLICALGLLGRGNCGLRRWRPLIGPRWISAGQAAGGGFYAFTA